MMGIKNLVIFASTLIASVVSDDCFDYGTDYFGFDLGLDHLVSFRRIYIWSCDSKMKVWLFTNFSTNDSNLARSAVHISFFERLMKGRNFVLQ